MALNGSDVVDARGMNYLYIPIWEYVNSVDMCLATFGACVGAAVTPLIVCGRCAMDPKKARPGESAPQRDGTMAVR